MIKQIIKFLSCLFTRDTVSSLDLALSKDGSGGIIVTDVPTKLSDPSSAVNGSAPTVVEDAFGGEQEPLEAPDYSSPAGWEDPDWGPGPLEPVSPSQYLEELRKSNPGSRISADLAEGLDPGPVDASNIPGIIRDARRSFRSGKAKGFGAVSASVASPVRKAKHVRASFICRSASSDEAFFDPSSVVIEPVGLGGETVPQEPSSVLYAPLSLVADSARPSSEKIRREFKVGKTYFAKRLDSQVFAFIWDGRRTSKVCPYTLSGIDIAVELINRQYSNQTEGKIPRRNLKDFLYEVLPFLDCFRGTFVAYGYAENFTEAGISDAGKRDLSQQWARGYARIKPEERATFLDPNGRSYPVPSVAQVAAFMRQHDWREPVKLSSNREILGCALELKQFQSGFSNVSSFGIVLGTARTLQLDTSSLTETVIPFDVNEPSLAVRGIEGLKFHAELNRGEQALANARRAGKVFEIGNRRFDFGMFPLESRESAELSDQAISYIRNEKLALYRDNAIVKLSRDISYLEGNQAVQRKVGMSVSNLQNERKISRSRALETSLEHREFRNKCWAMFCVYLQKALERGSIPAGEDPYVWASRNFKWSEQVLRVKL